MSPIGYSILFVVSYLFLLILLWKITKKRITLFFLFFLTYGLFIGGSFWAVIMGYDVDPFSLNYYYEYVASDERRIDIMFYILGFLFFSLFGYKCAYCRLIRSNNLFVLSNNTEMQIANILQFLFPVIAVVVVVETLSQFLSVLKNGYLALYVSRQNESYSGTSLWITLLPVLFGLAMTYGYKKEKKGFMLLYLFQAIFRIVMGTRALFGALLLFFLWIYSKKRNISLKKVFILCLCFSLVLIFVFSFSIRAGEELGFNISIKDVLLGFIHTQGVSLMVFDALRLVENYPTLAYFQTIFPGCSFLYSLFFNKELHFQDICFDGYMCYILNPWMLAEGHGMGWTLMSDLYLFSGRVWLFYLFLSFLFGFVVAKLESLAENSPFFLFIEYVIVFKFLLLPRAGLNSVLPLLFYSLFFWSFFVFVSQILIYMKRK